MRPAGRDQPTRFHARLPHRFIWRIRLFFMPRMRALKSGQHLEHSSARNHFIARGRFHDFAASGQEALLRLSRFCVDAALRDAAADQRRAWGATREASRRSGFAPPWRVISDRFPASRQASGRMPARLLDGVIRARQCYSDGADFVGRVNLFVSSAHDRGGERRVAKYATHHLRVDDGGRQRDKISGAACRGPRSP